jgi:hypothetical protein
MSASTILSIAYWLLRLANSIYTGIQQDKLIALGGDRQNAKALLVLQENARAFREIDERFDRMTDAEVREEITKQGDWRD